MKFITTALPKAKNQPAVVTTFFILLSAHYLRKDGVTYTNPFKVNTQNIVTALSILTIKLIKQILEFLRM